MAAHAAGTFQRFRGKTGLVMGLGVFGGGVEAARFLAGLCERVIVTDLRDESVLRESIAALSGLPVEYRLGEHREADFLAADVVVHSPAVRPDHPLLRLAREGQAETTMETSLFLEACPARTVGVTGSNGKTTTALLCYEMLCETMGRAQPELAGIWADAPKREAAAGGRVWLGGNCGRPLLNRLDEMTAADVVVLELSSFQLQDLHRIRRSCDVSLLTNITPNHLDWHRDFDEYVEAKTALYAYAPPSVRPWLNLDDPVLARLETGRGRLGYSIRASLGELPDFALSGVGGRMRLAGLPEWSESPRREDLRLPGDFNWSNATAAAALVSSVCRAALPFVRETLRRFRGVEHRLEFCGEVRGARCYNDSIATTPESTLAALSAFEAGVHLILGGSDKGLRYDELARAVSTHRGVERVYLQGANADAIGGALAAVGFASEKLVRFSSFDEACLFAFETAGAGGIVLMSPSSASFYEFAPGRRFTNFEHRGRHFKALVASNAHGDGQETPTPLSREKECFSIL